MGDFFSKCNQIRMLKIAVDIPLGHEESSFT